jgi:hypothetical protein
MVDALKTQRLAVEPRLLKCRDCDTRKVEVEAIFRVYVHTRTDCSRKPMTATMALASCGCLLPSMAMAFLSTLSTYSYCCMEETRSSKRGEKLLKPLHLNRDGGALLFCLIPTPFFSLATPFLCPTAVSFESSLCRITFSVVKC